MKQVGAALVVVLAVVGGLFVVNWLGLIAFTNMSGSDLSQRIGAELTAKVGDRVTVTCPRSIPEKKGGIEDCAANAGHGTTTIRLVQDDSRGHFHYLVDDPAVLVPVAKVPTSAPAVDTSVTVACINAGGAPAQCGCIDQAVQRSGTDADLIRAAESYNTSGRLPEDLALMADGCRIGA